MQRIFFLLFTSAVLATLTNAQSISIDGKFSDWKNISTYTDAANDGTGTDLLGFSVTNDEENLYIRLITNGVFNLSDSNNLFLNIDADNNASTGYLVNGIGAELGWKFGMKYGFYYHGNLIDTIYASQLKMVNLTTHKNDTFEIAISRNTQLGASLQNLFTSDTIKLNFVNSITGGDQMPNSGITRYYVFNNNIKSDFAPIELAKCKQEYIRVMSYNTAFDGLIDTTRAGQYKRIMQAINPDIIVFNECDATTYQQAKNNLDIWLPLGTSTGWVCYKVDPANIICSRFPIKYAKNISFRKATVTYIDLPSTYQTDLLFIGTHLMYYNDGDSTRQLEADLLAAYLRDMKLGLTEYKIPTNTPFIIAGDFNLVNSYSPLNTLLTGNIVNTSIYGTATFPDWNNMPISSVYAKVSDRNMAYTWRPRGDKSLWWPGKLDYILHSNVNVEEKKSFVLQTEMISAARLSQYGLVSTDCYFASDHLPIVADFQIPTVSPALLTAQWTGKINTAWENPANWQCSTVPDKYSNVIIPTSAPNYPYVNSDAEVHQLILNNGSSVNVKPSVNLTVNGL